jgi:uncharacterized protein YbgA (DUF1722 family)/uncharacterized protein YbbK (DUF523 family)
MNRNTQNLYPVRIGISTCLLGEKVRFDGGHKRDPFLVDSFGRYVEWLPVCPEVEMGLGTPRESLRLVAYGSEIQFIMPKSGADHTTGMRDYAAKRVQELERENLSGYVLKKDSPSCGMERVRVYQNSGMPARNGRGLFAGALMKHFPHLPVEEEGRLRDPRLRENFISHVFAYKRWQLMAAEGITRRALTRFHEHHKYLLMAHNQVGTRRLGKIIGNPKQHDNDEHMAAAYLDEFTAVMRRTPTLQNHTNALQHIAGYFSKDLDPDDREELTKTIHQYRQELLPLIVPITLICHYVRKFKVPYLLDQIYLNPHPHELMLLNQL